MGEEQASSAPATSTDDDEAASGQVVAASDPEPDGFSEPASSSKDEPVSTGLETEVPLRSQAQTELQAAQKVMRLPLETDMQQEALEELQSAQAATSRPASEASSKPRRAVRLLGLCGFDVAPQRGSGSKCMLCGSAIPKGSVRFDYQFSESGKMSRYIHAECCSLIPAKARQNSLHFLRENVGSDVAGAQIRSAIAVLEDM